MVVHMYVPQGHHVDHLTLPVRKSYITIGHMKETIITVPTSLLPRSVCTPVKHFIFMSLLYTTFLLL